MSTKCTIIVISALFFGVSIIPGMNININKVNNIINYVYSNNCLMSSNALLSYWSFDEGSGTIAHDYSGHNLNGAINGATWTTGYSGYALNFDGSDDYISLDEHSNKLGFNKTDDYKISAWIKTEVDNPGVIYMLNGDTDPEMSNIPFFYIKLNNDGIIEMKVQASEDCGITLNSLDSYNDGLWHYIEGIYHGGEQYPSMDLYIDKNFIGSKTEWLCSMHYNDFTKAKIGMKSYDYLDMYTGLIDEVKVYKRPERNQPPNAPQISGPTSGTIGEVYSYTFIISDLEGDESYLWVDWGDDTNTGWLGPYNSNENVVLSHSWSENGAYEIKARARDTFDVSEWNPLTVEMEDSYVPPHYHNPSTEDPSSGDGSGTSTDESLKADASLSETNGIVGVPVIFDGSKSSDLNWTITGYRWDFTSDKIYDTDWLNNPKTTYTFNSEGIFKVTLQVKNNNDLTDIDQINVTISNKLNNPPTKPIINGANIGTQNTTIYFTAISTDLDNDYLQYNFSWGDLQKTSSEFYANGDTAHVSHSWRNAGIYTITVYTFDNKTISETASFVILIDVCFVKNIGYLLDTNSDEIYDIFHFNDTGMETATKQTNDGYLLDYNGNGKWDHIYNLASGLSSYNEEENKEKTPGFELILIVFAIALILLWKRKRKIQ